MTPQAVVAKVAAHFGLSVEELVGPSRVAVVAYPRHIAMYLLVTRFGVMYHEAAQAVGRNSHQTALSAVQKITAWRNASVENVCVDLEALEWKLRPTRYRSATLEKEA